MLKFILSYLVLAALLLFSGDGATAQPHQKWCGTDSKNIFGFITSLAPEYYPQLNKSRSCPKRRAQIWRSCRSHDECEWHLGISLSKCHDKFIRNLKCECAKAFVHVPASLKQGCAALAASCNQIANIYYAFMLKGDLLTNSGNEAKAEARQVFTTLKRKLGPAVISRNRRYIFDRISFYCPRYKDKNNDCRINFTANRIIVDLARR